MSNRPAIALIGCGGISAAHLDAYRAASLNVTLLCDRNIRKAQGRRDEYFPDAAVTESVDEVLADFPDLERADVLAALAYAADRERLTALAA